jgi:hypothetical protein
MRERRCRKVISRAFISEGSGDSDLGEKSEPISVYD